MKRFRPVLWVMAALVAVLLVVPAQPAKAAPIAPGISITITPTNLLPGQAGYVFVTGGHPLNVSVTLDGQPMDVFWTGEGYLALYAFHHDAQSGEYELAVDATDPRTGQRLIQYATIVVQSYSYLNEELYLDSRLSERLYDPVLNAQETARLQDIYAARTQINPWGWPFVNPAPGAPITSQYGANRSYNGGLLESYHSGTDFRRYNGEEILATAAGRVVSAEFFEIRGNVVIIDHGYGIYSLYAHLSEMYVEKGDIVSGGQLIAGAGGTGRAMGPHLHFEIIVNGCPIDAMKWLELMPGYVEPLDLTDVSDDSEKSG
ncbi:MAG: M23 family metallopeptidase [Anaerolineae bacterium]|nr:M23 family metallopeptidase [Anaerolineae bacterium]